MIRAAKLREHEKILALAKQHPGTRDFGHMMFSGRAAYQKGWVRVFDDRRGGVLGFTCVRHKIRSPETSLYFIGVHEKVRRSTIGTQLLEDLKKICPNPRIALNVTKDNTPAIQFYKKHGFERDGESLKGKGWRMVLTW